MPKGWTVSYIDEAGELQLFVVGASDRETAIKLVIDGRADVSSADAKPMSDKEVERLNLSDGKVIQSRLLGA